MQLSETDLQSMLPHQILRFMHQTKGDEFFRDTQLLRNTVTDLLSNYEAERTMILIAIMQNIHTRILNWSQNDCDEVKFNHCVSTLEERAGMTLKNAYKTVSILAYAMERIGNFVIESREEVFCFIDDRLCCGGNLFNGETSLFLPDGERYFSGYWTNGKPQRGILTEKTGQEFEFYITNGRKIIKPK